MPAIAAAVGATAHVPDGQIVAPQRGRLGLALGEPGLAEIEEQPCRLRRVPGRQAQPGLELARRTVIALDLVRELGAVLELEADVVTLGAVHRTAGAAVPQPGGALGDAQDERRRRRRAVGARRQDDAPAHRIAIGEARGERRRGDAHRHRPGRRRPLVVAHRVGEAVDPDEARRRRVGDAAVGADRDLAVPGQAEDDQLARIAVGIAGLGQEIEGDGGARGGAGGDRRGDRRGVRAHHLEARERARLATAPVAHRVGELVRAAEARGREVGDALVGGHGEAALQRQAEPDEPQRIAVRIVVVGEQIQGERGVDRGRRRIVAGRGRPVRRRDIDGDERARRRTLRVDRGVTEAVAAEEARLRLVAQGLVGEQRDAAVAGRAERGDRQGLGVMIVGQDRDGHRDPGLGRHPVGLRHRQVVDQHGDHALGGRAGRVLDRVGEAVAAEKAGGGCVEQRLLDRVEDHRAVPGGAEPDQGQRWRARIIGERPHGDRRGRGGDDQIGQGCGQGAILRGQRSVRLFCDRNPVPGQRLAMAISFVMASHSTRRSIR